MADSERNLLHKKLFGTDGSESGHLASLADVLHKVESLFQERDSLVSSYLSVYTVFLVVTKSPWRIILMRTHCMV